MSSDVKPAPAEHLLETLVALVADEAVRVLGAKSDVAGLLGDEVAARFSSEFGGGLIYLPKGRVFRSSRMRRQIWEAFTGANHAELARQFDVSLPYIYSVLAKERERDRAERQQPLPGVS
jgi:Mor family transcriptional regulator